jgi:hypothetical protein
MPSSNRFPTPVYPTVIQRTMSIWTSMCMFAPLITFRGLFVLNELRNSHFLEDLTLLSNFSAVLASPMWNEFRTLHATWRHIEERTISGLIEYSQSYFNGRCLSFEVCSDALWCEHSQATVGFRATKTQILWLGRDREIRFLVPNQQLKSHHVTVDSRSLYILGLYTGVRDSRRASRKIWIAWPWTGKSAGREQDC